MQMRIKVLITLVIGCLPALSMAQKVIVSLAEARELAITNNRQSLNASLAVKQSEAKLWESIATGLPQVEVKADYTNFLGASADFMGRKIEFNPTSNASLTASTLLFNGNYYVGIQMAKLAKTIAETNKAKTNIDLSLEVASAYYLALVSQQSLNFANQNLENLKAIHEKTRLSAQVGIVEQTALDQLTVQVNMVENGFKATQRQVEMAYNLLRLQMGITADTELVLTDSLDNVIAEINIETATNTGFNLENNIDLQLMATQETITEKQVRLQQAAYLPSLVGFYTYTEKLKKPELDFSPNHMLGVNLTIPVFSSGVRFARVKQAKIDLEMVRNQRQLLTEQLQIREKQARYNLRNAWEQYQTQSANVEVAGRVFQNINLKFEQGLVSGIDLTTASTNYVTAQNNYVMAVLQLLQADTELERIYSTTSN
jgi:outer membrane protein TolC